MRKAFVGTLVVAVVVLLCLWFGLVPWTNPGESPDRRPPSGETAPDGQPSGVQESAEKTAVQKEAPRPGTESADTQREPDEEKIFLAGYTLDQDGQPLPRSRVGLYAREGQCRAPDLARRTCSIDGIPRLDVGHNL